MEPPPILGGGKMQVYWGHEVHSYSFAGKLVTVTSCAYLFTAVISTCEKMQSTFRLAILLPKPLASSNVQTGPNKFALGIPGQQLKVVVGLYF